MPNTTARLRKSGENFEIIVDMDQALKFKKGETSSVEAEGDRVFRDAKKGMAVSNDELETAFETTDVSEVAKIIVKQGEVLTNQEYRDEEREKKVKQVVEFLAKNSINPQTGNPHTSERIKNALEQANVNIKNSPIDAQIKDILEGISKIIPIAIKTKKLKITIPAIHTGRAYGVINTYKESEDWLGDGSLSALLNVPSGALMEFYDKLNSVTHGSAVAEEIKE